MRAAPGDSAGPPFSDPINDIFDGNAYTISAEPYLDIVSVDIWKSTGNYTIEIVVNGPLPERVDPSLWIEWDIPIDNNSNTGWRSPLLFNDLGVDYVIRVVVGRASQAPGHFV